VAKSAITRSPGTLPIGASNFLDKPQRVAGHRNRCLGAKN